LLDPPENDYKIARRILERIEKGEEAENAEGKQV